MKIEGPQDSLIKKIINITTQKPRVGILMSGKGSNAEVILNNQTMYPNFLFRAIFTDQPNSNSKKIARKYNLAYYEKKFDKRVESRSDYFRSFVNYFRDEGINFLVYAGFMKISPNFLISEFPGVNIHPSDLTIIGNDNKPKYRGMDALSMAIETGESYVASSVHAVDVDVDCGSVIAVSKRYKTSKEDLSNISSLHERLKLEREHILYPQVLSLNAH